VFAAMSAALLPGPIARTEPVRISALAASANRFTTRASRGLTAPTPIRPVVSMVSVNARLICAGLSVIGLSAGHAEADAIPTGNATSDTLTPITVSLWFRLATFAGLIADSWKNLTVTVPSALRSTA
jgi:hypothetical protein